MKKFRTYNSTDYNSKRLDYRLNFKGQQNRSFSENMKSINETVLKNPKDSVNNIATIAKVVATAERAASIKINSITRSLMLRRILRASRALTTVEVCCELAVFLSTFYFIQFMT